MTKTETKYTPTPLKAVKVSCPEWEKDAYWINDSSGRLRALILKNPSVFDNGPSMVISEEEANAFAALIVRAVNAFDGLLEAAIVALDDYKSMNPSRLSSYQRERIKDLEFLIAKAEGR